MKVVLGFCVGVHHPVLDSQLPFLDNAMEAQMQILGDK